MSFSMKGSRASGWHLPERMLFLLLIVLGFSSQNLPLCLAQGTAYSSRAEFEYALNSSTTITFETLPPTSELSTGVSPVLVSAVTFTNLETRLFITSPPGAGLYPYPIPGTGQYLWNYDSGYPVGIYLPPGTTAFGADFSGGMPPATTFNATLTATLADGQSYACNFLGLQGSWTFFGVIFSQPIVKLVYTDGGQDWPGYPPHEEMMDNVSFGPVFQEPRGPMLSITRSNQNVIISWPQTGTNFVLVETGGINASTVSNGIVYVNDQQTVIPSDNYSTNGDSLFVVLTIDVSTNKFYLLKTDAPSTPSAP